MVRLAVMVILVSALAGCSDGSLEEFYFRKSLEISMSELCGDNAACVSAVEQQTGPCMRSANWRRYMNDDDNPEELKRFTTAFYGCIVDADGNPYFDVSLEDFSERSTRDKGAISTSKDG